MKSGIRTYFRVLGLFIFISSAITSCSKKEVEIDPESPIKFVRGGGTEARRGAVPLRNGGFAFASTVEEDAIVLALNPDGTKKWQTIVGGEYYDDLLGIIETSNGNIIGAGSSRSQSKGVKGGLHDGYVVVFDANGKILNEQVFGGVYSDGTYGVTEMPNGDILLTGGGRSAFPQESTRLLMVRMDPSGEVIWSNYQGLLDGPCEARDAKIDHQGNLAILAQGAPIDEPYYSDRYVPILLIVDPQTGDTISTTAYKDFLNEQQVLPNSLNFYLNLICEPDGYLMCKSYEEEGSLKSVILLLKADLDGNLMWSKKYSADGNAAFRYLTKASDGGYYIGGLTTDQDLITFVGFPQAKSLVMKVDDKGRVLWTSSIGSDQRVQEALAIAEVNSEIVVGGYSQVPNDIGEFIVYRLNSKGELINE